MPNSRIVLWLNDYAPPSLRTLCRQDRTAIYRHKYGKRGLSWRIREACRSQGIVPCCDDKKKIITVTVFKKGFYEDGNFIGGLAPLIEVLKVHRFYADDDPDHLALKNPKQEYSKDKKGTEIVIEDAT